MADKLITALELRDEFSATCNIPVDDSVSTKRCTGTQLKNFISSFGTLENYSASVSYSTGALVIYSGNIYRSLQNSNEGNTPSSSPTYWIPLRNRWQRKTLSSNHLGPTSNGTEVTDLTFTTCVTGRTYFGILNYYTSSEPGYITISWGTGAAANYLNRTVAPNNGGTIVFKFTAIQANLKVFFSSQSGGGSLIAADPNNLPSGYTGGGKTTELVLTELNMDTEETL